MCGMCNDLGYAQLVHEDGTPYKHDGMTAITYCSCEHGQRVYKEDHANGKAEHNHNSQPPDA